MSVGIILEEEMKKAVCSVFCERHITCCLLILLFGFSASAGAESQSPEVDQTGVKLTIEPAQEAFEQGQPVLLKARLENISESSVELEFNRSLESYGVKVVDEEGNEAQPTQYLKDLTNKDNVLKFSIGKFVPTTLAPDQAVVSTVNASKFYDFSMSGKYSVTVDLVSPYPFPVFGGRRPGQTGDRCNNVIGYSSGDIIKGKRFVSNTVQIRVINDKLERHIEGENVE